MSSNSNHLIYKNTIIIYARMLFVTFVGLFSARFVLHALGASDYGLYNVVGGLIALFNFLGSAMSTTSRRYINVEMGKVDGNLNKIFNICLVLHAGFAFLILLIAETIGIWYINNYLNVADGKMGDAMFVFQVSTIVACIGIINIPYQSLIEAYEKFGKSAIIDILVTIIKFGLIIVLLYYPGNALRFYALLMCGVSLFSFILYQLICSRSWPDVIKYHFYSKSVLYKEILIFNNYTAMGAIATIGRAQGSNMIVNYFFGTMVNAAFAIAYQVEHYVYMFVNKITQASNPQIAINFSSDNKDRVYALVEKNSRLCILIMSLFFFPLVCEIDFILSLWLEEVPEGTSLLCLLTLISALVTSFSEGTNGFIQASGKIKWFQIVNSLLLFINLPIGCLLFIVGFDAYWIIICYIIVSIIGRIVTLIMMKRILYFELGRYVRHAYVPPMLVICFSFLFVFVYRFISIATPFLHFVGMGSILLITGMLVYFFGLTIDERYSIKAYLVAFLKKS